jgi:hypothetical protein
VIAESPRTAGLSGDHGWNDNDDRAMRGVSSVVLVVAAGAYWGSLWLLAGLPPLASLAARKWRHD